MVQSRPHTNRCEAMHSASPLLLVASLFQAPTASSPPRPILPPGSGVTAPRPDSAGAYLVLVDSQGNRRQVPLDRVRSVEISVTGAPDANGLWSVLNSDLFLLAVGFVLTTVAGTVIGSQLQQRSWEKQTRIDLFHKRYEEGTDFLHALSTLIGRRFFGLQRLLWALGDASATKIQKLELEYFGIVNRWNSTYWRNRNDIRLLIGEVQALEFLDY